MKTISEARRLFWPDSNKAYEWLYGKESLLKEFIRLNRSTQMEFYFDRETQVPLCGRSLV